MLKGLCFISLVLFLFIDAKADFQCDSAAFVPNFIIGEVNVESSFQFANKKEEKKYKKMEADLQKIYPLIQIVRSEYARVNREILFLDEKRRKEYLKKYETYAKHHYMQYLSGLNPRQGRLFLKMISRELKNSPYEIIREYRNGYSAFFWQGTAFLLLSNLKVEYDPDENAMIEHVMHKLDAENLPTPFTGR